MKEYVLSYYPKFKCTADKCKHTCCAGWEMNIDSESLSAYKNDNSAFAKSLKDGINFKKSKFKVDKDKRCAFLNELGLCEIIINLGEKSLCQVCRDHPRFRSFFDDRIETGLGFSCEEAAKIILSFNDKIVLIKTSDTKESEELSFNQKNVIAFRDKALAILQDRKTDINERISALIKECKAEFSDKDCFKAIKKFLSFEKLNKVWAKRLKGIYKRKQKKEIDKESSLYAEQFLVNSLYRHLPDAEDTLWVRARMIACILSWWMVYNVFINERKNADNDFDVLVDVVRNYSEEVEYSQNNTERLYSFAYKFIKI